MEVGEGITLVQVLNSEVSLLVYALLHKDGVDAGHLVFEEGSDIAHCPAKVDEVVAVDGDDAVVDRAVEFVNECDLVLVELTIVHLNLHEWVLTSFVDIFGVSRGLEPLGHEYLLEERVLLDLVVDLEMADLEVHFVL